MEEIWKPIEDYEDYEISNFGKIKKGNKILKQYKSDKGYLYVSLSKNNNRKCFRTHILVAKTFMPDKSHFKSMPDEDKSKIDFEKLEINHKDEDKTNNCIDNLEWCSHNYNIHYGNAIIKATQSRFKKINQYDLQGNFIKMWNSIKEASLYYKNTHIRDVLKGRRKTAGGYIWKYVDE